MLSAVLVGAGVALLVIAAALWPTSLLVRTYRATEAQLRLEREQLSAAAVAEREQLLLRIRELERQVSSMHRQGLVVEGPAVDEPPPPALPPLPREALRWLEGVEDPDARLELEQEIRTRLGADPDRPVDEILSTLTTL